MFLRTIFVGSGPRVSEIKNNWGEDLLANRSFSDLFYSCMPTLPTLIPSIESNMLVPNPSTPSKKKKGVNFYNKVSVILIPQRVEFLKAGLGDELWWNSSDYKMFKTVAVKEITEYMKDASVDLFTAVNHLYHTMNDYSGDSHVHCTPDCVAM